ARGRDRSRRRSGLPRRALDEWGLAAYAGSAPRQEAPVSFGTPLALLGLLVVPALVVLVWLGERRRRSQRERFGTPALVAASAPAPRRLRRVLPLALALVALAALIVGLARPRAMLSVPGRQA